MIGLLDSLAAMDEVRAIGKSGGVAFSERNESDKSDIDIFVFCDRVPGANKRLAAVNALGKSASEIKISEVPSRFWGMCDFLTIHGTEACLMYFAITDMNAEIESVLNACRLDREDEYFYPTGRCATFLSMHSLCDKDGYIAGMKRKLSVYPPELSKKLYQHHKNKINDEEDFERAVSRGDVLFYHATLELAIDHFLQALFALNHCFFPSRKRTIALMDGFAIRPAHCGERLLQAIEWGARPETLQKSYDAWCALCEDFLRLQR